METRITKTLTADEIKSELDMYQVRMQRAEVGIQEARANLDNVKIEPVSNEKREQLRATHLTKLEKCEAEAIELAELTLANIEEILKMTSGDVPTLTPDEMVTARTVKDFIQEDIQDASISDLLTMLRRAVVTQDKATIWNFVRYLPQRLVDSEASWEDSTSKATGNALRTLLAESRAMLRDGRLDSLHSRAIDLRSVATELDFEASKRTQAGKSYSFQSGNEVPW